MVAFPDPDADGQQSIGADGDDTDGTDDEDGVTLPIFTAGQSATVVVAATNDVSGGGDATLFGYIDFNNDGDFDDTGETASVSVLNSATGSNNYNLVFNVPLGATTGINVGARFRLTTDGSITTSTPNGAASDGEVEDFVIQVQTPPVPPVAVNDTATTPFNTNVTLSILSNDSDPNGTGDPAVDLDPSTIDLDPAASGGSCTSTPTTPCTQITVPGEGIYTVNATGTVTFSPEPGFTGTTTPISYTIDDLNDGLTSNSATITVTVAPPPASIMGSLWLDEDGDGVQDIGEPPITGATVELQDGTCTPLPSGAANCPTIVTDASGNYDFPDLTAGTYNVQVIESTIPANLQTAPGTPVGSLSPTIVLPTGGTEEQDFGYVPNTGTAAIGDTVYADQDGDGVQDPGEAGIADVTVNLISAGPDGVFGTADDITEQTTTTTADGGYLFTNVTPGEYIVVVDSADPDISGYSPTTGPGSEGDFVSDPVSVLADDIKTDVDFGFDNPNVFSYSDKLWNDTNEDGDVNPGELPIAGVTVDLIDSSGNIVATVTSGEDGEFTFAGIENGNYTVVITDENVCAGSIKLDDPTSHKCSATNHHRRR